MKIYKLLLISIALPLLVASQAMSATRYASSGGSGSTCSVGSPCTIDTALGQMGASDTLLLYGGTYTTPIDSNTVSIPVGTSWATAPQIKAVTGETPIIQPVSESQIQAVQLVSFQGSSNYLIQYVIFDGIILDGSNIGGTPGASSTGGFQMNGAQHIRFINGEVRNFFYGSGLEFSRSQGMSSFHEFTNVKLYNNGILDTGGSGNVDHGAYASAPDTVYDRLTVYNNGHIGMQLYNGDGGTDRIVVKNSIFHNNGAASSIPPEGSIELWVRGDSNQIYNNVFYSCSGDGLALSGASNAIVYNNSFYNCASGITAQNNTDIYLRNNILYLSTTGGNLYTDYGGNSGMTTTPNLLTNPGFFDADAGNFHLTAGSDAIGAGDNLTSSFTTDAEGTARPGGSTAWDLGAFVYGASSPTPVALQSFYKCDGNANDSADGSNGTLLNGALANGAPLVSGNSCVFDGTDDAIDITPVTNMIDTNSFSSCWWVKPTATDTYVGTIFQMGDSYGMAVQPDGSLSAFLYNGTTWPGVGSTGVNLLDGQPHFACVTYDRLESSPAMRLYVDDAEVGINSTVADVISYVGGEHLWIGRHSSGDDGYFYTGTMDQGRIYTGQLSAAAIHTLFLESGRTRRVLSVVFN